MNHVSISRIITSAALAGALLLSTFPAFGHDIAGDLLDMPEWTSSQPEQAPDAEVDRLISELKDESIIIRTITLGALGETGSQKAVKPLTEALKDPDWHIKKVAARSLCRLCGADSVDILVSLLKDDSLAPQNTAAVAAFARTGSAGQDTLISLLKESDPKHRTDIINLLSALKGDSARDFVVRGQEIIISMARDTTLPASSRVQAIKLIEAYGDSQAVDPLMEILNTSTDPNGYTRIAAATALARINDPKCVKKLISLTRKGETPQIRAAALSSLSKMTDKDAIDAIYASMKADDPGIRINAVYALANVKEDRAIKTLFSTFKDTNDKARGAAIASLGNMKEESAVEPLIAILKSDPPDPSTGTAVFALGKIGDARAVESLAAVGSNKSLDMRDAVCRALGQINDASAAKALIPYLDSTYPLALHQKTSDAITQLTSMGSTAVEALIEGLKSENPRIREGAAIVFWKTKDSRSVAPLISLLTDQDAAVRSAAATALGVQEDKTAVAAIAPLLKDTNPLVKSCAASALGELGDPRGLSEIVDFLEGYSPSAFSDGRYLAAVNALGKLKDPRGEDPLFDAFPNWGLEDTTEARSAIINALTNITEQSFGHSYFRWLAWAHEQGKWNPQDHHHAESEAH